MSKLSKKLAECSANKYLLLGAPNVGKSTIFNLLTTATSLVGNVDRLTTNHTIGKIKKTTNDYLIDLPGIYNLSHPLDEEEETHYHLLETKNKGIISVINAFSIERDLLLVLQCLETGLLNTLVVNMIDLINTKSFNWKLLKKKLNGINLVLSQSNSNKNVKDIVKNLDKKINNNKAVIYSAEIEQKIKKLEPILPTLNISKRFISLMLLENNKYITQYLEKNYQDCWKKIEEIIDFQQGDIYVEKIKKTKEKFISKILNSCKYNPKKYLQKKNIQNKLDNLILKKFIGIPLFFLIVLLIYYLSFGNWTGGWIQNHFHSWLNEIVGKQWLTKLLTTIHCQNWLIDLLINGIFNSLFLVLAFLPPIIILYTCVTIIQQIGLLSRVSILMDNALSKFGLSGRAIIILLTAFGCYIPALMLTKSTNSKKERIISILIIPFLACSTKVIVISFIANIIFGFWSWLCVYGFVLGSGIIALFMGLIFSQTLFRKQKTFFCIELPNWNKIDLRILIKTLSLQIKHFLKKTILVICLGNLFFWLLLHLGINQNVYIPNDAPVNLKQTSLFFYISYGLSYLFFPIFGGLNWQLTSSLLAGIVSKEIILTNLSLISNYHPEIFFAGKFGCSLGLSFMTFILFSTACLPAINLIRTETNKKWLLISFFSSFIFAYILAGLIYWISYGIVLLN